MSNREKCIVCLGADTVVAARATPVTVGAATSVWSGVELERRPCPKCASADAAPRRIQAGTAKGLFTINDDLFAREDDDIFGIYGIEQEYP